MHTFKASVQYDDLKGSVAADDADKGDARDFLKTEIRGTHEFAGLARYRGRSPGHA